MNPYLVLAQLKNEKEVVLIIVADDISEADYLAKIELEKERPKKLLKSEFSHIIHSEQIKAGAHTVECKQKGCLTWI